MTDIKGRSLHGFLPERRTKNKSDNILKTIK